MADKNKKDAGEVQGVARVQKLIKENYVSGITVALVSLPLSTALAIAAGSQPMAGISAGVYGPLMGGLFGSSAYNILGPAGALVNNLNKLSTLNGPEIIPMVAMLSGVFSLLVWMLRLEKYCTLIPVSVLEGFSLGVAITIGCGQLNSALGLKGLVKHPEFAKNLTETFAHASEVDPVEFVPFLCMYLMLMTLMKVFPGRPWIIFIALVGMIYGFLTAHVFTSIKPTLLKDLYPAMLHPSLVDFSFWEKGSKIPTMNIVIGAAQVSFVAVLETLISARIADNKTGTRFQARPEVFGMSLGNILSGIMGGTPCTGVLVRTGVNISAGSTDKMSQLLNGVAVALITLIFMPAFVFTPMPCIASILIVSASRLIPFQVMGELIRLDAPEFIILIITTAICVLVDGAFGLMTGGIISILRTAIKSQQAKCVSSKIDGEFQIVYLSGQISYINALQVETEAIDQIAAASPENNHKYVIVDCKDMTFIDIDGITVLEAMTKHCKKNDITISFVCLANVHGFAMIDRSNFFKANVNDQMTDSGPYTREAYSLDPMKETMRTIGFKVAHNMVGEPTDDYLMADMGAINDDAAPAEMEGGNQIDDETIGGFQS